MPLEKVEAPYVHNRLRRIQQGELLRDFVIPEVVGVSEADLDVQERHIPYCVVLTQDCDLEHDFNSVAESGGAAPHDKNLLSLLLCPAYLAEPFRLGEHLKDEGKVMQRINSAEWGKLKTNQNARYHYLGPWTDLQVPELVVDFKHYFTVPRSTAYREESRACYLATLEILYREHLSSRFAHYLSRIGLPELTSP